MRIYVPLSILLVLLVLIVRAVPAGAAPPSGVLAAGGSNGPVAAYANTVAWSQWDTAAGGYRIVVDRGGKLSTLGVAPSATPFTLTAGPGPNGATWLVWSRCNANSRDQVPTECDVEGYDLGANTPRAFRFAAKPAIIERAPSIWRGQLAWVTGSDRAIARVHIAAIDSGREIPVKGAIPPSTCRLDIYNECYPSTGATVQSLALRGDQLAVGSRVSTGVQDVGICGLATVRLLDLRTGAARMFDDAICGLSGQGFSDLTFDASGRLWWRPTCSSDQSACLGGAADPYRQTSSNGLQRLTTNAGSRLSGVAVADRTPVTSVLAAAAAPGCWTGAVGESGYKCATLTAVAAPTFRAGEPPKENVPPAGYVTVTVKSGKLRLLQPPARMACSYGDLTPHAGAQLWAGASWLNGKQRRSGPAVPFTVTSGSRMVRGTVPKGKPNHEGQVTAKVNLGGPSNACARTWTITYRPPGMSPVTYKTRVSNG